MANVTLTNKAKIVILFANQYDMKDETGDKLSGCSVHYMFWGEDGEVLASEVQYDPTKPVGVQRAKCSVDSVLRNKIVVAPGLYEGTFEMIVGAMVNLSTACVMLPLSPIWRSSRRFFPAL